MNRFCVLTLIAEKPGAHGVYAPVEYERREVFCSVKSVGMNEVYQARAAGLAPDIKFVIPYANEYCGEKLCEYENKRYRILRTYNGDTNEIELTCQLEEGNAYGNIPADGYGV